MFEKVIKKNKCLKTFAFLTFSKLSSERKYTRKTNVKRTKMINNSLRTFFKISLLLTKYKKSKANFKPSLPWF